jgi:hypothetical protein
MTWAERKERARQVLASIAYWILVAIVAVLAFYALMVLLYLSLGVGIVILVARAFGSR